MQPQPWSQLRRPRQPVVQIRELSPCQRVVMALQQQQRARATRWPQQTWLNESVVGRSLLTLAVATRGYSATIHRTEHASHDDIQAVAHIRRAICWNTTHAAPTSLYVAHSLTCHQRERGHFCLSRHARSTTRAHSHVRCASKRAVQSLSRDMHMNSDWISTQGSCGVHGREHTHLHPTTHICTVSHPSLFEI
jgi:hypothetical protein